MSCVVLEARARDTGEAGASCHETLAAHLLPWPRCSGVLSQDDFRQKAGRAEAGRQALLIDVIGLEFKELRVSQRGVTGRDDFGLALEDRVLVVVQYGGSVFHFQVYS